MAQEARLPWQGHAGRLPLEHKPIDEIMDELYAATGKVRVPRSKAKVTAAWGISRYAAEYYLACVGAPWTRGYGPPPADHLVWVVDGPDYVIRWASPSTYAVLGRGREQQLGQIGRNISRGGQRQSAEFARIADGLRAGTISSGELDTWILQPDQVRLSIHCHITYGSYDCFFIDALPPRQTDVGAELFNVRPGRIPPEFALPENWTSVVETLDDVLRRLQPREGQPINR